MTKVKKIIESHKKAGYEICYLDAGAKDFINEDAYLIKSGDFYLGYSRSLAFFKTLIGKTNCLCIYSCGSKISKVKDISDIYKNSGRGVFFIGTSEKENIPKCYLNETLYNIRGEIVSKGFISAESKSLKIFDFTNGDEHYLLAIKRGSK